MTIMCAVAGGFALLLLSRLFHHRFAGRCYAYAGPGCGHRRHRRWGWGGPRWSRRFFARGLADHLGATADQEKVIVDAFDELRRSATGLRQEVGASRADVAAALRQPAFDEVML